MPAFAGMTEGGCERTLGVAWRFGRFTNRPYTPNGGEVPVYLGREGGVDRFTLGFNKAVD